MSELQLGAVALAVVINAFTLRFGRGPAPEELPKSVDRAMIVAAARDSCLVIISSAVDLNTKRDGMDSRSVPSEYQLALFRRCTSR